MSLGPRPSHATSADYRAAIAQWRLNLRTEVKRCSSLPSSMFDACDPTLETHLAATAEAVLMALLGNNQDPFPDAAEDASEQRREQVDLAELRELPNRVAEGPPSTPPQFEAGLEEEYLSILSDICCVAEGDELQHAMDLLQRDFGVSDLRDLEELRAQRHDRKADA